MLTSGSGKPGPLLTYCHEARREPTDEIERLGQCGLVLCLQVLTEFEQRSRVCVSLLNRPTEEFHCRKALRHHLLLIDRRHRGEDLPLCLASLAALEKSLSKQNSHIGRTSRHLQADIVADRAPVCVERSHQVAGLPKGDRHHKF